MSSDGSDPTKPHVPPGNAPDASFLKKFEAAIRTFAEATEEDNAEGAQAAAMEALALVAEQELKNPDPAVRLMNEADDLESKGAWSEAQAARRNVLALQESLGNSGLIAKAQMDLCRSLLQVGRGEEAWQLAVAATASARSAKITLVIVMALLNETVCALAMEDVGRALSAASEAVRLIEPGKLHDNIRARALTARAKCLLASGDPAGAAADLASAKDLLPANPDSIMMQGINWTVGDWWEVKSRLEQSLGNEFVAREAITLAIEHRRQSQGPNGLLALARGLESLAKISNAAGDLAAAEEALAEAKSIRTGLHLPGDN